MPRAATASTRVSMSVARMRAFAAAPSVSLKVIASEYGSSPVDAAEHQMRWAPRPP